MKRVIAAILLFGLGLAVADSGGPTVRAATLTVCAEGCQYSSIQAAMSNAQDGDVISVGAGTYTENLFFTAKSTPPVTAMTLTVMGAGADQTTIVSSGSIDFGGSVVFIDNDYDVSISGVTITGGRGGLTGGGILSSGNLTLHDSVVSNSTATYGAGLYLSGTATLVDTQVISNTAEDNGGGIWSAGTLTLIDSTVTGNTAGKSGGGILNGGGVVRLQSSNVTGNTPDNCAGTSC
ncbi:MAG: hypothetical protein ACRDJE_18890 [Dehalococcoidia bacterium]